MIKKELQIKIKQFYNDVAFIFRFKRIFFIISP